MNSDISRAEAIKLLAGLIKDIQIAMLTTVEEDGRLRSRPMATQHTPFDGELWFFTNINTPKVREVLHYREVNISYAQPDQQTYISVSGMGEVVTDWAEIEKHWHPVYKTWFPHGPTDPSLALLRVHVDRAEFWEAPSGVVVHLIGLAKARAYGQSSESDDTGRLTI
jgi:general stress protein 26